MIFSCVQVDIAAPLSGSLAAGQPTEVVGHQPSFVDGMGGKTLFPEMWPLARRLLSGVFKLSLQVHVFSTSFHLTCLMAHVYADAWQKVKMRTLEQENNPMVIRPVRPLFFRK